MKTRIQLPVVPLIRILIAPLLLAGAQSTLRGQLVPDGATATISGFSTNLTGNLTIGTNGIFTTLGITNTGTVTNSGNGYIGRNGVSLSNRVFVVGINSVWQNGGTISVGENGSFNQLTVSNAALVANSTAYVGRSVGRGNQALVTGANSRWLSAGEMIVGDFNGANQLWIADGGLVASTSFGRIGNSASGTNNLVVVKDVGSLWTNQLTLYVGASGSFNRLVVTNGGRVESGGANIGLNSGSISNLALMTGTNSIWRSSQNLILGSSGAYNTLIVSNGGGFECLGGTIGNLASGNTNLAIVTGTNSSWALSTLAVGINGSFNQLVVTNGGSLVSDDCYVSANVLQNAGGNNNTVVITGPGSTWTNTGFLTVGNLSGNNRLVVTNGGVMRMTSLSSIWLAIASVVGSNSVIVTGSNSLWSTPGRFDVGLNGPLNQLWVRNAATVQNAAAGVGYGVFSSSNLAVVADAGSIWTNGADLAIGTSGSFNQLVVSNGGTVFARGGLYTGLGGISSNNTITLTSGNIIVTNSLGTSVTDVRRGTFTLNSGLLATDTLLLTNASGRLVFNGGTLITRGSTVSNGQPFVVGNGTSVATYNLLGHGQHSFNNGLVITNNSWLTGQGRVSGTVTVHNNGRINLQSASPTDLLILSNSPVLLGNIDLDLSRNTGIVTNDQIQVAGNLVYGGYLFAQKTGADPLVAGDRFQLFSASSYSGAFTAIQLPGLPAGLRWKNQILTDGSIEVVTDSGPRFHSVVRSGTNLVFSVTDGNSSWAYSLLSSTNVTLPVGSWTEVKSGAFDGLGNVTLTNSINLNEPQRYYRLETQPD
jgi:T5SS/PEP-CTERM-associated repeat protein